MAEERVVGGIGCFAVLAALSDYLDGEAPADLVARIEAHLAECGACEEFGHEMSAVVRALRERLGEPERVEESVRQRLFGRLGFAAK